MGFRCFCIFSLIIKIGWAKVSVADNACDTDEAQNVAENIEMYKKIQKQPEWPTPILRIR